MTMAGPQDVIDPTRVKELCAALGMLIGVAEQIRHWHDAMEDNSGMVVSADAVQALWSETEIARAVLKIHAPDREPSE
jgi:hypothetical protein